MRTPDALRALAPLLLAIASSAGSAAAAPGAGEPAAQETGRADDGAKSALRALVGITLVAGAAFFVLKIRSSKAAGVDLSTALRDARDRALEDARRAAEAAKKPD